MTILFVFALALVSFFLFYNIFVRKNDAIVNFDRHCLSFIVFSRSIQNRIFSYLTVQLYCVVQIYYFPTVSLIFYKIVPQNVCEVGNSTSVLISSIWDYQIFVFYVFYVQKQEFDNPGTNLKFPLGSLPGHYDHLYIYDSKNFNA